MSVFLDILASILEADLVCPEDRLVDLPNWDSLSALSILAMTNVKYGVTLTAEDLGNLSTTGELERFVIARAKGGPQ